MTADIARVHVVPKHYTWSFPGCPVKVRLSLEVIEEWQRRLEERGSEEQQGVLLGRFADGASEISGYKAVPADELASAAAGGRVVGYFRLKPGAGLHLSDQEVALAYQHFAKPHQVVMVIEPGVSGPATAAFFFWDHGQINGEFCFLEFPLDAAFLETAEREGREAAALSEERRKAAGATPPVRESARSRWIVGALAVLLVTGCGATLGWQYSIRKAVPRVALPDPGSLGLRAELRDGNVYLTWRRDSNAVARAAGGSLTIRDGATTLTTRLDASQLRQGSVLYAPATEQIQMELTVSGPGPEEKEMVIAFLPRSGPVENVVVPPSGASPQTAGPERQVAAAGSFAPLRPWNGLSPLPVTGGAGIPGEAALELPPPATPSAPQVETPAFLQKPTQPAPPAGLAVDETPARAVRPADPSVATSPVAIHRVMPQFPPAIRGTFTRPVAVQVKLKINEAGKVVEARAVDSDGIVSKYVEAAAVRAASEWIFRPAQVSGRPVSGEIVLRFRFDPR